MTPGTARDPEDLIAEHIALDNRGPAEARLADYGVRVWAVIGALRANAGDASAAAADYELPPEAMAAAFGLLRSASRRDRRAPDAEPAALGTAG